MISNAHSKVKEADFRNKIPDDLQREIGLEFDEKDPKYRLACFPLQVRKWYGYLMSGMEIVILLTLLTLNIIHFTTYSNLANGFNMILIINLVQIGLCFVFEILLVVGLITSKPNLIKFHHPFQGLLICACILNASFTFCTIYGSYDESQLFLIKQPALIKATAYVCFVFAIIEIYMFNTSAILCKFEQDKGSYKKALKRARQNYRYKILAMILALARRNLEDIEKELANEKVINEDDEDKWKGGTEDGKGKEQNHFQKMDSLESVDEFDGESESHAAIFSDRSTPQTTPQSSLEESNVAERNSGRGGNGKGTTILSKSTKIDSEIGDEGDEDMAMVKRRRLIQLQQSEQSTDTCASFDFEMQDFVTKNQS